VIEEPMPEGIPLERLYRVIAIFVLFAVGYGLAGLTPGPVMVLCFSFGPLLAVASWLAADARHTRVGAVYDAGWLFAMSWPISIPWYATRTRGRAGWWLAAQLYASTLAAPLGIVWGGTIRAALRVWLRHAA
jgi:hypothetical protein